LNAGRMPDPLYYAPWPKGEGHTDIS